MKSFAKLGLAAVLGLCVSAQAATVGTFASDYAFPAGTVSGNGTSATWVPTASGNAAVIAPVSAFTLNVGDSAALTGTVTLANGGTDLGNVQVRFGLFNTNGTTGTSAGWLGYLSEIPNAGAGVIAARGTTGNWASGTGATGLTTVGTTIGTAPSGTYSFNQTITRTTASAYAVTTSFLGNTFNWTASATDTASASASNGTFNQFGFFIGGSPGGLVRNDPNQPLTFSNVAVTVPEPASLAAVALGGLGILARRRKA